MALLYNIVADRELRESDEVKILVGENHGCIGCVVGFDLMSDRPIVVQRQVGRGTVREKFAANEVEIRSYVEAPAQLEPLPTIRLILSEALRAGPMPEGRMATLRMSDGSTISIVAKQNQDIRRIYKDGDHQTVEERVFRVLTNSYVTRLPHLMKI